MRQASSASERIALDCNVAVTTYLGSLPKNGGYAPVRRFPARKSDLLLFSQWPQRSRAFAIKLNSNLSSPQVLREHVFKRLELNRIVRRVEEGRSGLFAGFALDSDVWR